MTPLPFSLPAVLSLDALRASRELTLVQIYDQYPTQAARAACVLSREVRPERPVVVLAELEADGLTADQWAPDALLALFEGVGASALILACPADPDRLSVVLRELVPYAAVPLGVCVPSGMEDELAPRVTPAQLLVALDDDSLAALQAAAERLDYFAPLPAPEDHEDERERPLRILPATLPDLADELRRDGGKVILKAAGAAPLSREAGSLTAGEVAALAALLKGFPLTLTGDNGMKNAQVTQGGAVTAEFHAGSMESKLMRGLYACGEVLDIDGDCGGFNLQWAWSSGRLAGESAAAGLRRGEE